MKILLVDDDPEILHIATFAFEKEDGFEVIQAEGAMQALEILSRERPDILLVDFVMPDMDGPELIQKLLANENLKDIPFIFFTAEDEQSNIDHMLSLGALGTIKKPFDPTQLASEIKRILK